MYFCVASYIDNASSALVNTLWTLSKPHRYINSIVHAILSTT